MEAFLLFALILINALFAMSEIALVTARKTRLSDKRQHDARVTVQIEIKYVYSAHGELLQAVTWHSLLGMV